MLLCTTGRILLGYLSAMSLWASWWPPRRQNRSPWCSPGAWKKGKSHSEQDQLNREIVLARRYSSRQGSAEFHFTHAQIFGDNLPNNFLFRVQVACDHSNSQLTIALTARRWPQSCLLRASSYLSRFLPPHTFFESLVPLRNMCAWNWVISIHLLKHFKCLWWSFSQVDQKFLVY